jgi:hypothetical protein
MTQPEPKTRRRIQIIFTALLLLLLGTGLLLRAAGLFRGLASNYGYHPDEPKQVAALEQFLQNRYVWYMDSPFYDGYPLALNHLDEWIMRPLLHIRQAWSRLLAPSGMETTLTPNRLELFYWARGLRVFYGMLILLLTWRLGRRLFNHRGAELFSVALLAMSPLAITVSHFATGDIGADLFTLLALYALAVFSGRQQTRWLILSAMAVGAGFACKYQAALGGLMIALYLAAEAGLTRKTGQFFRRAGAAALAFITGAMMATPAFFINPKHTWRDICINFEFIRNYDAGHAFLQKPLLEQIRLSLGANTIKIIESSGWTLVIITLAGTAVALAAYIRERRKKDPAAPPQAAFFAALTLFPPLAALLSIAGKPEVQTFHFAYLQAPLILAATYTLLQLARLRHHGQWLAIALAGACLLEAGRNTRTENFFWTREDNKLYLDQFDAQFFRQPPDPTQNRQSVKTVFLEPTGIAVFRNRIRHVISGHGDVWNRLQIAPVPDIAFSLDPDWIFDNGPVFPRNDRTFPVSSVRTEQRHLVLYHTPERVWIGVRSGRLPATLELTAGSASKTLTLMPNRQALAEFKPQTWRKSAAKGQFKTDAFLVPIQARSKTGHAWITVMTTPQQVEHFRLFGGESTNAPVWPSGLTATGIIDAVDGARFLESTAQTEFSNPGPPDNAELHILTNSLPLPCGRYTLECDLKGQGNGMIELTLTDGNTIAPLMNIVTTHPYQTGWQTITQTFAKTFAPHEISIHLRNLKGQATLLGWRLRPETCEIMADIQQWKNSGTKPAWLESSPEAPASTPMTRPPLPITFNRDFHVTGIDFPATIQTGKPFHARIALETNDFHRPVDAESCLFIHLLANRKTMCVFQAPLWQFIAAAADGRPVSFAVTDPVPPGDYQVIMGLYNSRTRKRIPVSGPRLSRKEKQKRTVNIGKTRLIE